METYTDMNVKIQNSGVGTGTKNTGSCGDYASYLEHEDDERLTEGKEVLEFFTPEGCEVTKEEVISKIDRNHGKLGKNDIKFYSVIISPSEDEVLAMGDTESERIANAKTLAKQFSQAYVENFGHEHVTDSNDMSIFWKIHTSRGDNHELQLHLHGIVARKDKTNKYSLSPMTNHRKGTEGVIKCGFDRNEYIEKCETIFDAVIGYNRRVDETFAYNNALRHGSLEEKKRQADLLAEEKLSGIKEKISGKVRSIAAEEVETKEDAALAEAFDLDKGFELLELKENITDALRTASDISGLSKTLMAYGIFVKSVIDSNGHVSDVTFTHKGNRYLMSTIFNNAGTKAIQKFCAIAGLKPAVRNVEQPKHLNSTGIKHKR